MAQARYWLWGLIPLAVLWLSSLLVETKRVEKDLAARTSAVLASGPWVPAVIKARGRDIGLGGEAYDLEDRAGAVATADAVRGVRLVKDRAHLVADATPYTWSAIKVQDAVTLTGHVPKPLDRTKIFATAGAGGSKVTDLATYAGGAPPDFTAAAARLGLALSTLQTGTVAIDGTAVSIKGVARDAATRGVAIAALGQLPVDFTVGAKDISVPTYMFEATKDAAKNNVTFTGTLPDTATRETMLATARKMFVGSELVDRTKLQAGAPDGFSAAAMAGLQQLSRLDSGALKIADKSVDLTGAALYDRAVDQIKGALGTVPAGFTTKGEIKAKTPGAPVDQSTCQQRFNELLSKGTVQFETGSAKIDTVSAGILDHLVAIAAECPSQALEISGHTDAAGNADFNMDLSKKRAQAVVDYLSTAGLDAGHLTAIGYGKTKPIASNDTDEGRAKNRRIEFLVK